MHLHDKVIFNYNVNSYISMKNVFFLKKNYTLLKQRKFT